MKSTIRLSFFLLLLTHIVFGQTRTVQKDVFIQSRNNENQPITFNSNTNLYPPQLAALKKNALYEINGNKIKFYIFENMSVNQALIATLSGLTPTFNVFTEINDIYLDQDTYGVRVLRSGEFEYKTYVIKGKFEKIITLEVFLDVIPKGNYYFDFPGRNTLPYKKCYDTTLVDGKKAILKFQTVGSNEPVVEWLKSEKTHNMPRIKQIDSVWSFDLCHSLKEKSRIENDTEAQVFFYKLKNIDTVFRLKIGISFGCQDRSNIKESQLTGTIFVPPYAGPFKQPNTTDMNVSP